MTEDAPAPADDGWEWAVVEVFGHRKHYGRIREEERYGAKMLRIDIPLKVADLLGPAKWTTLFYGGSAVFSMALTTEADVMAAVARQVDPPSRLTFHKPDDFDEDDYP